MIKSGERVEKSEQRKTLQRLLALFAVAALMPWAHSQTTKQPISRVADLSGNIEEVSLDLVVHDKKNRPVLDLKPGEVAVTDDGSSVALNSLRLITGKQESEPLITLVFDRPAPSTGIRQKMDAQIMKKDRDAATKILTMFPANGFFFSVLDVERRLLLQQGFTDDRKALAQALDAATETVKSDSGSIANQPEQQLVAMLRTNANSSGKPISVKERAMAQSLFSALDNSSRIAQDQHVRLSLAGLLALAQSQQPLVQRKAIIFFASFEGRHFDSRAEDTIKSIIGAANRAGVSIYIIDLNDFAEAQQVDTNLFGQMSLDIRAEINQDAENSAAKQSQGMMQQLAEGTGGTYIAGDSLRKPLEQMIQDMTTYYVASYLPTFKEHDGKFHSVAVKPLRSGLKIRSQAGYLALPMSAGGGTSIQPFELPLLKILSQTPLPTDLAYRAAILRMGEMPEGDVNTLAIEAPLSSVEIREDSSTNLYAAHLSIIADIKDKTGAVIQHFSEDIPSRGALREIEMVRSEVVTLQRHFIAPPGQYILETAILDRNSGKAGAQRESFEIPNASSALSLSDMVLVRHTEPFRAEDDPSEPLLHGNDKVTPNLSGQLPLGAKDVSLFILLHSDPHVPEAATLNIQVFRDGKPLGGAPMTSREASPSGFSSLLTSFSVKPPMDGLYEVKATLNQGGKTADASASFTLAGIQPANNVDAAPNVEASVAEIASHPAGPLVITSPTDPIHRPEPDALKSILADAAHEAINYSDSLPNFICEQVTNRLVGSNGKTEWKRKDRFSVLLTYLDHKEKRTMLAQERYGVKSYGDNVEMYGAFSYGEFGSALRGVFQSSSKADFQWKEAGMLGDATVQVFDYRVARENSTFNLQTSFGQTVFVGFHGQVFIDSATRRVRRIAMITDDVPKKFPIHSTSISVDYDYVTINNHDYLLPVGAQTMISQGRGEMDLNEIEFRNFRRFGSSVKILDYSPDVKP
jgi:VWFA-related protein